MGYPASAAAGAAVASGGPGRPPCDRRQILNGIFYRAKTGCPWHLLPPTFSCWQTVYDCFHRWQQQGHWQRILAVLTIHDRTRQGRPRRPSAGSIDAQSIHAAMQGIAIGYDAGKKVKGRKRHLLVDTDGRILQAVVTAASGSDADGLKALLRRYGADRIPRLRIVWSDGGYRGKRLIRFGRPLGDTQQNTLLG